jgi:cytochrome d ubiquinol oxidase subunit I
MGRQPWIVYGLLRTAQSASPNVSAIDVAVTLIVFVAIYTALGIVDAMLMVASARRHLDEERHDDAPLTPELVY